MPKPTESYMAIRRKPLGMKVLFITKIFLTHEMCQHINMPHTHLLWHRNFTQEYIVTESLLGQSVQGKRHKGGYTWTIQQSFLTNAIPLAWRDIGEDWKYFNITTSFNLGSGRCTIRKGREIQ